MTARPSVFQDFLSPHFSAAPASPYPDIALAGVLRSEATGQSTLHWSCVLFVNLFAFLDSLDPLALMTPPPHSLLILRLSSHNLASLSFICFSMVCQGSVSGSSVLMPTPLPPSPSVYSSPALSLGSEPLGGPKASEVQSHHLFAQT